MSSGTVVSLERRFPNDLGQIGKLLHIVVPDKDSGRRLGYGREMEVLLYESWGQPV